KTSRDRHTLPSRATITATGHAAALAPASPARVAGGETQAYDHHQTAADSLSGADSLRFGGGADPDPTSVSHQAPALDLQRTGVGNPRQRGIPLCQRPTAAHQKAGFHSRPE